MIFALPRTLDRRPAPMARAGRAPASASRDARLFSGSSGRDPLAGRWGFQRAATGPEARLHCPRLRRMTQSPAAGVPQGTPLRAQ